jgi:CheY-like chemotaxis protein
MPRAMHILVIEDNPGDVVLLTKAMESSSLPHSIHVVDDGCEAINFLQRRGEHAEAPRPDLILLDHNLPRKNGTEILAEIFGMPSLSDIPLILLSGSKWERHIVDEFGLPHDRYMVKPNSFAGYSSIVHDIERILSSHPGNTTPVTPPVAQ